MTITKAEIIDVVHSRLGFPKKRVLNWWKHFWKSSKGRLKMEMMS